ncbi:MAG: alpha/beta fold hydrolase [Bacteroidia bacterium]
MKLNYKSYGSGPALIILHGLFGSLDNWVTHARILEKEYSVYLLDQRNHGRSPHSKVFDYQALAADLNEFMESEGIYQAHLLGHSMGGKTVMEFAGHHPEKVDKLIVADMSPRSYPPHHTLILETLENMNLSLITSRKEAETYLMEHLENDVTTSQFLLKGLGRNENNEFTWKFNLPTIVTSYNNILAEVSPEPLYRPTLFISGGKSKYVQPEDHALIQQYFPEVQFTVMPNVGHWLHAENPALFLEYITAFLR